MFKENTFYKAKKGFNLSIHLHGNETVEILKNEMLFILSGEYSASVNLYAVGLIKDFKFYNSFWGKCNMVELMDEIT